MAFIHQVLDDLIQRVQRMATDNADRINKGAFDLATWGIEHVRANVEWTIPEQHREAVGDLQRLVNAMDPIPQSPVLQYAYAPWRTLTDEQYAREYGWTKVQAHNAFLGLWNYGAGDLKLLVVHNDHVAEHRHILDGYGMLPERCPVCNEPTPNDAEHYRYQQEFTGHIPLAKVVHAALAAQKIEIGGIKRRIALDSYPNGSTRLLMVNVTDPADVVELSEPGDHPHTARSIILKSDEVALPLVEAGLLYDAGVSVGKFFSDDMRPLYRLNISPDSVLCTRTMTIEQYVEEYGCTNHQAMAAFLELHAAGEGKIAMLVYHNAHLVQRRDFLQGFSELPTQCSVCGETTDGSMYTYTFELTGFIPRADVAHAELASQTFKIAGTLRQVTLDRYPNGNVRLSLVACTGSDHEPLEASQYTACNVKAPLVVLKPGETLDYLTMAGIVDKTGDCIMGIDNQPSFPIYRLNIPVDQ